MQALVGAGPRDWLGPQAPTPLPTGRLGIEAEVAPLGSVGPSAAKAAVPKLDMGAVHPQQASGAGTCGAVAYLLAGGPLAAGVPMGSAQGAYSGKAAGAAGLAGSMFDGLPAAPRAAGGSVGAAPGAARAVTPMRSMGSAGSMGDDHSWEMEDAGAQALATLEALGPLARNAMRVYLGLGMGVGEGERGHGRRAHSTSCGAAPVPHGSDHARANTLAPQEHDWRCPLCSRTLHGRHKGCWNCRVDKDGRGVVPDLCPWQCTSCGHINPHRFERCRGKEGAPCNHLRSIVGAPGAGHTKDDWVCVRCREHGLLLVRMGVGKKACRSCHTALADMPDVTHVRDYPDGTAFE